MAEAAATIDAAAEDGDEEGQEEGQERVAALAVTEAPPPTAAAEAEATAKAAVAPAAAAAVAAANAAKAAAAAAEAVVAEAEERNGAGDTRVTASVVASVVAEVEARPAPRSGSPRHPEASVIAVLHDSSMSRSGCCPDGSARERALSCGLPASTCGSVELRTGGQARRASRCDGKQVALNCEYRI